MTKVERTIIPKRHAQDTKHQGGVFTPRAGEARPVGGSPRLLGIASAACFGAPLGLACRLAYVLVCAPAACTCQVLVCLLRAPPTGSTHSASRTSEAKRAQGVFGRNSFLLRFWTILCMGSKKTPKNICRKNHAKTPKKHNPTSSVGVLVFKAPLVSSHR